MTAGVGEEEMASFVKEPAQDAEVGMREEGQGGRLGEVGGEGGR